MNYTFLKNETAPKLLVEAYKLLGIKETLGKDNNPVILSWAEKLGLKKTYTADEIPWCGLFVAYVCFMAGKVPVTNPLFARNWANWGSKEEVAMLGDILVFSRGSVSGHVGIYVGEDDKCYHVLGGNQGDQVSIVRVPRVRCIGIRRTKWSVSQPESVRIIKLSSNGVVSENEA